MRIRESRVLTEIIIPTLEIELLDLISHMYWQILKLIRKTQINNELIH